MSLFKRLTRTLLLNSMDEKRRIYRQLPHVKEAERNYYLSERGKEVRRRAACKYYRTQKGKERRKRYNRTLVGKWKIATNKAKEHGQEWGLTRDQYAEFCSQKCTYCDQHFVSAGTGLDRLDNSQGYILGNVVPCCKDCNILRGNRLTPEETRIAVQAVLAYRVFGRTAGNILSVSSSTN